MAEMQDFVLITGCSGGGKSTLLAELARRGFVICEEPGRRIVREELASGGDALPWDHPVKFAERAARLALADLARAAERDGITVFDRGVIDAVCALERMAAPIPNDIAQGFATMRYASRVFFAPPWPEIFANDPERPHGFEEARIETEHLAKRLPELGYDIMRLPKAGTADRANFVIAALNALPLARR